MPSEDSLSETCRESRLNNPDNVSKVNEHIRNLNQGMKKLIIFYPFLTRKFVKSKSQREYNVFFSWDVGKVYVIKIFPQQIISFQNLSHAYK